MRKFLIVALLISAIWTKGFCAGENAFDFVTIPNSAETSVNPFSERPASLSQNPAFLSVDKSVLDVSFSRWFEDLNLYSLGFGQNVKKHFNLGFLIQTMSLSNPIEAYTKEGLPDGTVTYSNFQTLLGANFQLTPPFKLGLSLGVAGEDIAGDKKNAPVYNIGAEISLKSFFFSAGASNFLTEVKYTEKKFPVEATYTIIAGIKKKNLFFDIGLLSSQVKRFVAGFGVSLGDIGIKIGLKKENKILIPASALEIKFGNFALETSYLSNPELGATLFTTFKTSFDMMHFYQNVTKKIEAAKKEERKFVKIGTVKDFIETTDEFGEKQIIFNFESSREFSGEIFIVRNKKIAGKAIISDTICKTPLIYEAFLKIRKGDENIKQGDIVVVKKKTLEKQIKAKEKEYQKRLKKLKGKINTAQTLGWETQTQKQILKRAEDFLKKEDFDMVEEKISILKKSIEDLYLRNSQKELKETQELLKDAKMVGIDTVYPESLILRAKSEIKKGNYRKGIMDLRETKNWLEKTLEEMDEE